MAYSRAAATVGTRRGLAPLLLILGFLILAFLLSFSLTKTSSLLVLGGFLAFLILGASFLKPEFGVTILIMSMLLSPEIGLGGAGGGSSVEGSRSVVIRLDDILLVILSAAWFARTAIHKNLGLILANPLNRPIAIYVLSCFISTIVGFMAGNVRGKIGFFFVIRYIEYFVVFFLAINFINSVETMKRFMKIAFFTAVAIALYGMSQIPLGVRVSAPFEGDQGEPNTMGGYLLLIMCMVGGQLLFARGMKTILRWSGFLLMLTIPLLFTGSRASWLGIPGALAAFFLFSHRKKAIMFLLIGLLVSGNVILPQSVKERILFTFKQQKQVRVKQVEIGGVRLDTSTSARLESYKVSLDGWRQKPILGWGITGFVFVDSQVVRTLAETGLLGLAAFALLVWGYFQAGLAAMRTASDRFQRGLAIAYIAGLFGLLLHSSGSNTFIILRIMEPWMLFTAMMIRIPAIQAERDRQWAEMELTDEEKAILEAPPEEAAEGEAAAGEGEAADGEDDAADGDKRFEKKLTDFEKFLERERIEMKRREIEAKRRGADSPEFRKAAKGETPPAATGKNGGQNGRALPLKSGTFPKVPRNQGAASGPAAPGGAFPKTSREADASMRTTSQPATFRKVPRNIDLLREKPPEPPDKKTR